MFGTLKQVVARPIWRVLKARLSDGRPATSNDAYQTLCRQQRHAAVSGTDRNAKRRSQLGNRRELVAGPKLTIGDLLAQASGYRLVRAGRHNALSWRDWSRRHPSGQRPCRPLVRLRQPGCVHPEGRCPTAAMTKPAGDRPYVNASVYQLGCRVVPQCVNVAVDAEPGCEPAVPLSNGVGSVATAVVRFGGEDVIGSVGVSAELRQAVKVPTAQLTQHFDRLGVESHPPLLVRLGVLLPQLAVFVQVGAAPQRQHTGVQVEMLPAQRTQFTAPGARRHGKPDQRAPVRVTPRFIDDARGFGRVWRLRVGVRRRRGLGLSGGVDGDPAPPDGATERTTEDPVNLAHGRSAERLADVRPALRRASVFTFYAVFHVRLTAAPVAAATEARVERLQRLGVESANRQVAQHWPYVLVELVDVAHTGGGLDVGHLKPSV